MVLLIAILTPGCTIHFVKNPAQPELVKQRIEYFKWLYEKGFYRSEPELMKRAASKLLEVAVHDGEEAPSWVDALERLLHRLEDEIDRLAREKR
jgi:hypothetical protein